MKKIASILVYSLVLLSGKAYCAHDGFGDIHCGSDIAKGLTGQVMSNESVASIEGRHKNLGLKDLGGSEVSERLFLASWLICGSEYLLIEDNRSVVRDVIPFPSHSKDSPAFTGRCQVNGKDAPGVTVAILENKTGIETLPAKVAWKIDEQKARFVALATQGLRCPRDGIATQDGGL